MSATVRSSILGAVSGIFYASSGLFVKLSRSHFDDITIYLTRTVFNLVCFALILLAQRVKFWEHSWKDIGVVLATSTVSIVAVILQYTSYQLVSLATVFTIASSTPMFIVILSMIIHRRWCTAMDVVVVFLCILGVVLCAQPNFIFKANDHPDTFGVLLVLLAAFGRAIIYMGYKKASTMDVPSMLFVQFLYLSLLSGTIFLATGPRELDMSPEGFLYLSLNSLVSFLAISSMCLATKYGTPQMASVGKNFDILMAIIFDMSIYNLSINWMTIVGALLIITAIVMPAVKPVTSTYQELKDQTDDSNS